MALAGCEEFGGTTPPVQPVSLAPDASLRPHPAGQSAASLEIADYYARRQDRLLARDLLRRDGGGPDTRYSADTLARNFEQIVFFDEYSQGPAPLGGEPGHLRRWETPVRIGIEFGASVPAEQRRRDSSEISRYAQRLARVTGHPVSRAIGAPNFFVLVMGEDDKDQLTGRLRALAPSLSAPTLALFRDMPLSVECSVLAFSSAGSPYAYSKAVAVIRAELPDLLRLSCIHEEIAQGLGPANDSPQARPSIFNDDDEFALLTSHDELLLKMLYDPRLKTGMTADEARAAARIIARELMGQVL
ncbi:MAG: DUF2927 domain-containing protein [Marinibacterium sp.]